MAQGIYIDTRKFNKGTQDLKKLFNQFPDRVSDVLNDNALEVEAKAKSRAPADRGQIRQGISSNLSNQLRKHITSQAPYSAYMEFGTGKFAAQYVAKLPPTYKAYAAQFKGRGGGSFDDFIQSMVGWVKRHGLAKGKQERQVAYAMAIKIMRDGLHPQPFMIPSVIEQEKQIVADLKNMINKLHV